MSTDLEAAVADALSDPSHHHGAHTRPPGSPCANCATVLQGPWCHACGQFGDDYHRSAWHLVLEAFEGFFHFDGRFWKTLPDLVLRPGRLTRAYIDGHRAPQIPPLRLTLVVLLLVFVVGSFANGYDKHRKAKDGKSSGSLIEFKDDDDKDDDAKDAGVQGDSAKNADTKEVAASAAGARPDGLKVAKEALSKARQEVAADSDSSPAEKALAQAALDRAAQAVEAAKDSGGGKTRQHKLGRIPSTHLSFGGREWVEGEHWLDERIASANEHPEEFKHNLENWAERFAFLMLPLSALILAVLFVFQRRFWLFDHLVFSMHSLSFQGLLLVTAMLVVLVTRTDSVLALPVFIAPVHLYMHMRAVYGTSVSGTLIRMFLLATGSFVGAILLLLGLLAVGIAGMEVA